METTYPVAFVIIRVPTRSSLKEVSFGISTNNMKEANRVRSQQFNLNPLILTP